MAHEPYTVVDRLAPAMVSDDLSQSDLHRTDADYLGALAYASRDKPLISALLRCYMAGDWKALNGARRQVERMVRKEAMRRRINLGAGEAEALAGAALRYCAFPVCPRCHGTKYQLIPGSRVLGSTPCALCDGDGRRPLPKRQPVLMANVIGKIFRVESIMLDEIGGRL